MKELTEEQTKKVTKIFLAWDDDKEEKWLESMAAEGWKLVHAAPYVYYFQKSAPEKVVIRLDYKMTTHKDYQEYRTLFSDAGWELVAQFANWHYFRFYPKAGETPEIYNTDRAKAQKYRRLLFGLIPLFPLFMFLITRIGNNTLPETGDVIMWIYFISRILMFVLLLVWGFVLIKIVNKIKKLESHSKE